MHPQVERMAMVIALGANGVQFCQQLFPAQQPGLIPNLRVRPVENRAF
jgi:hypothetical protein